MRRLLPFLLIACVLGAFLAGHAIRLETDFRVSPESIQTWVVALGWRGPAIYLGLVIFRQFLFLPSAVVLSAGGLVFGALFGTVLGGVGILVSAAMKFGIARGIGRDWIGPRLRARFGKYEGRVERAGPLVVGLVTAHPMAPMSAFHWAAGLSTLPLFGFVVAVMLAGPVRAFIYSFFGSTLLELGSVEFYLAASILVAVALLPLAHPRVRRRLFPPRR